MTSTSRPASRSKAPSVPPPDADAWLAPPVTNGVTRRSSPRLSDSKPLSVPAKLTRVMPYAFGTGAQNDCSLIAATLRMTLKPQSCAPASGKRRVTTGIAISAAHPSGTIAAATCHTPSQSRLMLDVDRPKRPPYPSLKTCWSSFAPSGLVANMYAERESLKVSNTIWTLSSSRMRSESRRISVAVGAPLESKAMMPR